MCVCVCEGVRGVERCRRELCKLQLKIYARRKFFQKFNKKKLHQNIFGLRKKVLIYSCKRYNNLLVETNFSWQLVPVFFKRQQHLNGNNLEAFLNHLTLSWRRPLSYRNQSIHLQSKSVHCFLYDNGLRHERVNANIKHQSCGKKINFPYTLFHMFWLRQKLTLKSLLLWLVWFVVINYPFLVQNRAIFRNSNHFVKILLKWKFFRQFWP